MRKTALLLLLPLLLAAACGTDDVGPDRTAPESPFELTIDGVGVFEGRAEYEVSEPTEDYMPVPRLVLHGLESASSDSVVFRLGQHAPGAIDADYDFPAVDNAFLVEIDGKSFEGAVGEVRVDLDGKLEGHFALESVDVDGADKVMLEGHFRADRLFLNCNRLSKGTAANNPGSAGDGSDLYWEPDPNPESDFCSRMRDALGALYGG